MGWLREDEGDPHSPGLFPYGNLFTKTELYRTLRHLFPGGISPFDVSSAFDEAMREREEGLARLRGIYSAESSRGDGFHVVLLGRPYTVLSEWMNKGIPQTFASQGVPVFYQDMLSYSARRCGRIAPLLKDIHWHYAAKILEAAEVTAQTPGAYPVLVTSFKCSPDSFITDYVRQILESHGKPYLVLELDEHDSRLGYETRIEAAVRAFRNHHAGDTGAPSSAARTETSGGFRGFERKGRSRREDDPIPQLGSPEPPIGGGGVQEDGKGCPAPGAVRGVHAEKPAAQFRPVHSSQHHRPGFHGVCGAA